MLAIESSQRVGGVALRDADCAVHTACLGEGSKYDNELILAIDSLVRRANLSPQHLQAVGVSVGPGGFTGLRIAVATAKSLAVTLGVKLVAVPSALVAAESSDISGKLRSDGQILVALASKRNSYWATVVYTSEEHGWRIDGEPHLAACSERVNGIHAVLADRYFPDEARSLYENADVPIFEPRFDPAACLRVADRMLGSGQVVDPLAIKPIYPRPPEAVALWAERHNHSRVQ